MESSECCRSLCSDNSSPIAFLLWLIRCAVACDSSPTAATPTVARMAGQLRKVALHVAEGEPLMGLLEGTEHVGGNDLAGLDHAHGLDRRGAVAGR